MGLGCLVVSWKAAAARAPGLIQQCWMALLLLPAGHVNFADELSAALRLADGVLLVVDAGALHCDVLCMLSRAALPPAVLLVDVGSVLRMLFCCVLVSNVGSCPSVPLPAVEGVMVGSQAPCCLFSLFNHSS